MSRAEKSEKVHNGQKLEKIMAEIFFKFGNRHKFDIQKGEQTPNGVNYIIIKLQISKKMKQCWKCPEKTKTWEGKRKPWMTTDFCFNRKTRMHESDNIFQVLEQKKKLIQNPIPSINIFQEGKGNQYIVRLRKRK